jgi:glycosyltransferase involved in cell wall biosynthesis
MVEGSEASALLASLRVALVHDYLNQQGGAEKVVEVFCTMFPHAPLYTSVYDPSAMGAFWRNVDIRTSFMQRFSPRLKIARMLFPLYPVAFESFDLRDYDLVLSSTTAFAKGVITRPETCHVCYCNNPTRFVWMYHEYIAHERLPIGTRAILPWLITPLRVWDYAAAQRVDHFIAGSYNAARRIQKYYRRSSTVIQPPVDLNAYYPSKQIGDYYLVMARLQPYKRIDLAVEACTRLGCPLVVVGEGPDRPRLQRLAGPTVRFLGRVADEEARRLLRECRALLWPGEEDFGLVPIEAQASGRPVIAYRAGGALETVLEGETGILFAPQTVDALVEAIRSFDPTAFDPQRLRAHARRFDRATFIDRMRVELARAYGEHLRQLRLVDKRRVGDSGTD